MRGPSPTARPAFLRQADSSVRYRTLPPAQWEVCIPGHHAGSIHWDEYGRNLETMARNARSFSDWNADFFRVGTLIVFLRIMQ